jgi:hypothetical protein
VKDIVFALYLVAMVAILPFVHILLTKRRARHTFELPAWTCPKCRAFNGETKEKIRACRCCGAARP